MSEGSRLEAWMKSHKSEVAITFICTPTNQETVSVLEKTQANKTFRTANVKSKQQQLYDKYSNHVVYL